jgi:hypothetical protein
MLLGVGIAAWLIPGERTVGQVTFGVDTLAYALGCILVGFHACVFAVGAKVFGILEGLLPRDPGFDRWLRELTLERGVTAGGIILLFGIAATVYALLLWYQTGFGNLMPTLSLRITLPAVTALMLGVEIIFASFFLSLLGLARR